MEYLSELHQIKHPWIEYVMKINQVGVPLLKWKATGDEQ